MYIQYRWLETDELLDIEEVTKRLLNLYDSYKLIDNSGNLEYVPTFNQWLDDAYPSSEVLHMFYFDSFYFRIKEELEEEYYDYILENIEDGAFSRYVSVEEIV